MQSVFEDLYSKKILEEEFGYASFLQTLIDNKIPYKKIKMPTNMILLTEDTINTKVYFIEKGIVSLEKNKNVISFLGSNQIVGLNDYFMAEANVYTARVIETITAYEFDKEDIICSIIGMQEGWLYLYLNNRNHENILIEKCNLMRGNGESRLKDSLEQLGIFFGVEKEGVLRIPKCFTRKIIANYSNLSVRSVTHLCRKLIESGFLAENSKSFVLLNRYESPCGRIKSTATAP
ncbi:Crp/Fnr family transcriptional regulator [Listeria cossartiae]|uniref:Crp/Fnr family transcriptional regulator n=1 Tax=Listeria cossartiae TaxID=2838249 RepID=UPI001625F602|nr:Crp/Fnr family transcriptional regulator [Listeria cossartiae]MBC1547682.1 Crp/Fnr family transcriptional regulator [Listeria cossartiae subsp. cossartiae]MBC1550818.1 Crp/Fnr family transcriptional regulator [Listeria cossartiae subsp. cossartiae]MBC1572517.1 Crp/Fnr family transcriptional regulator [Listeria cossartiae subsp. cossartiae]MBC1988092.1 Crp/Fnr family transcriptional regulator [Listeria cossartiae subsp. cossartiae]MCD2225292.1 Crp/Fnr family transcriptional regulator [Lister